MTAREPVLEIALVLPWWTGAYMNALILFCVTFGTQPDVEKIAAFLFRHSKFRVAR